MESRQSLECIISIVESFLHNTRKLTVQNSLGCLKKGYTNGEIGRAWIENLDKETKAKANGRWHLLLVDGHNSQYIHVFLQYARANHIKVVGYPSHSTHMYQGLDVVIISPMKRYWTKACDEWEQQGHTVDKSNFLAIYAEAHKKALTPENIKLAFCKTGVIPFNLNIITSEMMAPSLTTSIQSMVPILQTSPVKVMSEMVLDYMDYQSTTALEEVMGDTRDSQGPSTTPFFM